MPGMYTYGTPTFGEAPLVADDPIDLSLRRLAVESISANESRELAVRRVIVESISAAYGGPEPLSLNVRRVAVESISSPSQYANFGLQLRRATVESISSAYTRGRGLEFTGPASTNTLSLVVVPAATGYFSVTYAGGVQLRIGRTEITWQAQGDVRTFPCTIPEEGAVVQVRGIRAWVDGIELTGSGAVFGAGGLPLVDIGVTREDQEAGNIAELMAHDRSVSDAELDYIRQYLACKWLSNGTCDIYTDLPPSP